MQLTLNRHGRRGGDLINKAYMFIMMKKMKYIL